MPTLDESVRAILAGAPELVQSPGLATSLAEGTVATGSDPVGTAQAASLAASTQGARQAQADQQQSHHHSIWGDVTGAADDVGNAVKGAVEHPIAGIEGVPGAAKDAASAVATAGAQALNYPLGQVQHYYRAQHDVWTRYGVAAWAEHFGLADANPVFMGDLRVDKKFQRSWDITANGTTYRDVHGNVVNPGFDLANVVDHVANGHDYMPQGWHRDENGVMQPTAGGGVDLPTGTINAVFDLFADPTMKLGEASQAARASGVVFGGDKVALATDDAARTRQLMDLANSGKAVQLTADGRHAMVGGRTLVAGRVPQMLIDYDGNRASNIPYLAQSSPAVRDAFDRLSRMDTAQIVTSYPMLRPMAAELGRAQTIGDVTDVFERAMTTRNYGFLQSGLPTTSLTRRLLSTAGIDTPTAAAFGSQLADSNQLFRRVSSYRPFTVNTQTLQLSGKEIDPDDPGSLNAIRSMLLISQDRKTADAVLAKYIEAPDTGTRINILANSMRDMLRAAGSDDSDPIVAKYGRDAQYLTREAMRPVYGVGRDGKPIAALDPGTSEPLSFGLLMNQTGKIALPDFNEVRTAVAQAKKTAAIAARPSVAPDVLRGGLGSVLARADDWTYNHFTGSIFKPLALLSAGFGFRVATAELIPAVLQNSARETLGSSLMAAAAKLNPGIREITEEYGPESLIGKQARVAAETADGSLPVTGKISAIDADGRTVHVQHDDPTSGHPVTKPYPFKDTTVLHRQVSDKQVMRVAADMGMEVDARELRHIKAAVGRALYGVGRALVDPDYYDTAVRNVLTLDGHLVAPGLSSNHDLLATGAGPGEDLREALHQAGARVPAEPSTLTNRFTLWDANRGEHPMFWQYANHEAAGDPGMQAGAKAYLHAINHGASETDAGRAFTAADTKWMKDDTSPEAEQFRTKMALYGQGADQYSDLRRRALEGLTYGADGTLHQDVLAGIAGEADLPSIADLAAKDVDTRPLAVKGREIDPIPHVGGIQRMTQWGWRRFIHPTINSMSRSPIYTMLTTQEYKAFQPWLDKGLIDSAEAHQLAQVRAANRMLPLIHNTLLRSQMSDLLRNVTPFYFAQEQAYKRYGKVILQDPVAFRKATLAVHGLNNSGILRQDVNGNTTIVLPGGGPLATWATVGASALGLPVLGGVPSVITGNMISLKSVVPEGNLPSVSPLVAVPLKEIQNRFPASEPFISKAIGGVNEHESATDELIPNTFLRRVLQTTPLLDRESTFSNAYLYNIAYAAHRADDLRAQAATAQAAGNDKLAAKLTAQADSYLPGPNADPFVKQKALDRIKNSTRIMSLVKAAIGFVSPLSPQMDTGDVGLRTEVQADITKYGLANGMQKFLDEHPDATADTVFLSDNTQTGTSLPATKPALDWVDKNRGWVNNHALAAAYLIPQTSSAYDAEAYDQELAMGLSRRKTPQQFLAAVYAAATDPVYYQSLDQYETQRAQQAGDSYAQGQLDTQWAQYKQGLTNANPVWAAQQDNPSKVEVARQTLFQLQQALADPSTPESPQTETARMLTTSYNQYLLAQQEIRGGQSASTLSSLQDQFNDYLDHVVQQTPAASALVTGVFRRLANAA